jgi:hypothetical protein
MRLSVRWHAAFHSDFDICVAGSQKPIQSASVLPPPPGALGAASLGLPGDNAKLPPPCFGVPPLEEMTGGTGGERGATLGTWGAGVPSAGAGVGAGAAGGGAGEGSGSVAPLCAGELRPEEERDWAAAMSVKRASARPVTTTMIQGT